MTLLETGQQIKAIIDARFVDKKITLEEITHMIRPKEQIKIRYEFAPEGHSPALTIWISEKMGGTEVECNLKLGPNLQFGNTQFISESKSFGIWKEIIRMLLNGLFNLETFLGGNEIGA